MIERDELLKKATQMVAFGMNRTKITKKNKSLFEEMDALYNSNEEFRSIIKTMCDGFKVKFLSMDSYGVLIVPLRDSFFGMQISEYDKSNYPELEHLPEKRMMYFFCLIGVITSFFPNSNKLSNFESTRKMLITSKDVLTMIRNYVESVSKMNETDIEDHELPNTTKTVADYIKSKTFVYEKDMIVKKDNCVSTTVDKILKQLNENKFLQEETANNPEDGYRVTQLFLDRMNKHGSVGLLELFREIKEENERLKEASSVSIA